MLVAGEAREFSGLRRHLPPLTGLQWPVAYAAGVKVRDRRLILVANGPGYRLAAEAMGLAGSGERVDVFVSTGFCGALDPALAPCEVVVASQVKDADEGAAYAVSSLAGPRVVRTATFISTDRVIGSVEEKRRLRAATGGDVVDMESAVVARHAAARGVPFACVRVVSDTADEGFVCDFNQARDAEGRFRRRWILGAALRRPRLVVPELVRLQRRSRRAAAALGEFLVNCEF